MASTSVPATAGSARSAILVSAMVHQSVKVTAAAGIGRHRRAAATSVAQRDRRRTTARPLSSHPLHAAHARARSAAEHPVVRLHAVADDAATPGVALRRPRGAGAPEAIEDV